jgi:hypothetical protein
VVRRVEKPQSVSLPKNIARLGVIALCRNAPTIPSPTNIVHGGRSSLPQDGHALPRELPSANFLLPPTPSLLLPFQPGPPLMHAMLAPLSAKLSGIAMPSIFPDVLLPRLFVDSPALFPICYLFLFAAAFPTSFARKEDTCKNK